MEKVVDSYRGDSLATFRAYKKMAERAISQVTDEEFFRRLDNESNSIAIIVKHISGNLISRFTDFRTADGEKAERDRDSEFIIGKESRERLMERWENGWRILFSELERLRYEDFDGCVFIRGEEHTIIEAINRQMTHYSYHTGQIVFLAKHFRSSDWKTLSVPRDKSAEFNDYLQAKKAEGRARSHPLEGPAEFARRKK